MAIHSGRPIMLNGGASNLPSSQERSCFLAHEAIRRVLSIAMLRGERRAGRVPVSMYCELIVDDEVLPAFVTSLSENGLYFDSLAILSHRKSNRVQMQLTLPGEEDPLWIVGDVIYDERGRLFNETAVRFVEMADAHKRALRRWIRVRELVLTTQPGRPQQENAA